jgi:hypothetical protein
MEANIWSWGPEGARNQDQASDWPAWSAVKRPLFLLLHKSRVKTVNTSQRETVEHSGYTLCHPCYSYFSRSFRVVSRVWDTVSWVCCARLEDDKAVNFPLNLTLIEEEWTTWQMWVTRVTQSISWVFDCLTLTGVHCLHSVPVLRRIQVLCPLPSLSDVTIYI